MCVFLQNKAQNFLFASVRGWENQGAKLFQKKAKFEEKEQTPSIPCAAMDWGGFTRSLRNGFWGRKCWKSKSGIRAETLVAQGFRELAESYCLGISAPHGKIQTIGGRIRETSTPHFWNKKRHFFRIFLVEHRKIRLIGQMMTAG